MSKYLPKINKQSNFLTVYQCILAVLAVFIFFTCADIYYFDSGIAPAPFAMVLLLGIASFPLIPSFLSKNMKYVPSNVFTWCFFYFFISIIYYLLTIDNSVVSQELDDRILTLIFFGIMLVILAGELVVQQTTRWAIFLASFWNIYTYIYEMFNQDAWRTLTTFNDSGRPAGFYVNPNKAAIALVFSLILSIQIIPVKYRLYYSLFILFGVFLTFSRSGIICTIISIMLFYVKKILPRYQLSYFFIGIIFLGLNLTFIGDYLQYQSVSLGISNSDVQTRIETFTNPSSRQASDDTSRIDIVGFALEKFFESPLFGHGLAYDQTWEGEVRPHNMYLMYIVQHGFVGFLIVHLLVFSVIKDVRGEIKLISQTYLIVITIWSFFTHSLIYDRESILVYALMAVLSKQSQLIQNKKLAS